MTVDESMSAYRPQTTCLGNLPFLSYIMQKPEDLGTEFKVSADAVLGVMSFIEIQKGRVAISNADFVESLGHKTAACTMRLMVGSSEFARRNIDGLPENDSLAGSEDSVLGMD